VAFGGKEIAGRSPATRNSQSKIPTKTKTSSTSLAPFATTPTPSPTATPRHPKPQLRPIRLFFRLLPQLHLPFFAVIPTGARCVRSGGIVARSLFFSHASVLPGAPYAVLAWRVFLHFLNGKDNADAQSTLRKRRGREAEILLHTFPRTCLKHR
jgi:hypothetical protein